MAASAPERPPVRPTIPYRGMLAGEESDDEHEQVGGRGRDHDPGGGEEQQGVGVGLPGGVGDLSGGHARDQQGGQRGDHPGGAGGGVHGEGSRECGLRGPGHGRGRRGRGTQ
uniref:Uncharacterized protein n=1 Tax=Janibacter limosus TaxID=53458 RepID=A0AC61U3U0_9MICO|nr:hypothetical protein [Janibacter limosus]